MSNRRGHTKGPARLGRAIGLALGAGFLILVLVLGIANFRAYARVDDRLPSLSPVQVWFQNPQQGSQLPVGSSIPVSAKAQGLYPILYLQLETDGQVVGVAGAPNSQGLTPFSAEFAWTPAEAKTYKLTARAFDTMGNEADSAALVLIIVAADQVNAEDVQNAFQPLGPHAPPGLGEGGGPPQPLDETPPYQPPPGPQPLVIDPNGAYDPSEAWSPSVLDWLNSLITNPGKPAAPGLPATAVEGCQPRIWISDNSDDEQGFRVFRRDPGGLNFVEIDVLDAHVGQIFTYDDEEDDLFGTYEYQVSAFNQAGESFSNISEPAEVDSPGCEPDGPSLVQIDLSKLFTTLPDSSLGMGYCYYSFDNQHWLRQPPDPTQFLPPGESPQSLLTLIQPQAGQTLDLECWDWDGGGPHLVGKWHYDDMLTDHADLAVMQPIGDGIVTYGGSGGPGGPWDPELPTPFAFLGTTPQECFDYSNIPGDILKALLCADLADDLDFVYWGYWDFSYLTGDPPVDVVGYNVYDTLSAVNPVHHEDYPLSIYFPIDVDSCTPRLISVTLLANVDGEIHESAPSNQIIYTPEEICQYLAGNEPRMYRITWETIDFSVGDIDDGIGDLEDDAEGAGWMSLVTGTGVKRFWHVGLYDGFEDESDDNPYYFAALIMGQASGPCLGITCLIPFNPATNNNTADFPLFIGEGFKLTVHLSDFTDFEPDFIICGLDPTTDNLTWNGNAVGGPGWVTEVTRTKHHNHASCRVTVKIEGLP